MIRRLLATTALTAACAAALVAVAGPSSASSDLCVGGPNQRQPGYWMGICVNAVNVDLP